MLPTIKVGPCSPGVVEHIPPGSLLNPSRRRPEHGGCLAALAPRASDYGSETDANSMFAAAASSRGTREVDEKLLASLAQKSNLFEQYLNTLERRYKESLASQVAHAPTSGYICELVAPSVQYPIPDAIGMPLNPSAIHDPTPTGSVGIFSFFPSVKFDPPMLPPLGRNHLDGSSQCLGDVGFTRLQLRKGLS